MKELKEAKFHTRDISVLVDQRVIEKIKPGFYRIADYSFFKDINVSLISICRAEPQSVICLISALDYYEMTDFNPSEIFYAIPHSQKRKNINYPSVKTYSSCDRFYTPGIAVIQTKYGDLRIYNKQKTVCDMFRYRNKLGEDLASIGGRQQQNLFLIHLRCFNLPTESELTTTAVLVFFISDPIAGSKLTYQISSTE